MTIGFDFAEAINAVHRELRYWEHDEKSTGIGAPVWEHIRYELDMPVGIAIPYNDRCIFVRDISPIIAQPHHPDEVVARCTLIDDMTTAAQTIIGQYARAVNGDIDVLNPAIGIGPARLYCVRVVMSILMQEPDRVRRRIINHLIDNAPTEDGHARLSLKSSLSDLIKYAIMPHVDRTILCGIVHNARCTQLGSGSEPTAECYSDDDVMEARQCGKRYRVANADADGDDVKEHSLRPPQPYAPHTPQPPRASRPPYTPPPQQQPRAAQPAPARPVEIITPPSDGWVRLHDFLEEYTVETLRECCRTRGIPYGNKKWPLIRQMISARGARLYDDLRQP